MWLKVPRTKTPLKLALATFIRTTFGILAREMQFFLPSRLDLGVELGVLTSTNRCQVFTRGTSFLGLGPAPRNLQISRNLKIEVLKLFATKLVFVYFRKHCLNGLLARNFKYGGPSLIRCNCNGL